LLLNRIAFSEFIDSGNLRAHQLQFVKMIIDHFTPFGFLDHPELANSFKNVDDTGLFELFEDDEQDHIIRVITEVNENAMIG
jgi:type I restriction enzyme R subunit